MKKLTLRLDDLRIDTFATTAAAKEEGTVFGEQCSCNPTECSCPACLTCDASCGCTGAACPSAGCPPVTQDCTWDYSCGGCEITVHVATSPGPQYHCMLCGPISSIC